MHTGLLGEGNEERKVEINKQGKKTETNKGRNVNNKVWRKEGKE
jgi:hypothetical protein